MALTRDFRKTIAARARRDSRFREALLTEASDSYVAGNTAEGKAILRDSRIALDRLSDKDDPIVSSAELKRRLARKSRVS